MERGQWTALLLVLLQIQLLQNLAQGQLNVLGSQRRLAPARDFKYALAHSVKCVAFHTRLGSVYKLILLVQWSR